MALYETYNDVALSRLLSFVLSLNSGDVPNAAALSYWPHLKSPVKRPLPMMSGTQRQYVPYSGI